MGMYQYTMRKDVLEIAGMKIGRFDFAYKLGRDWEPGGRTGEYRNGKYIKNRTVLRFEAQAAKARSELSDVEYVVVSSAFNEAAKYGLEVYPIGKTLTQFTEEPPAQPIGTIKKIGKEFVFVPIAITQKV